MQKFTNYLAYNIGWVVPVMVADNGDVFYLIAGTNIKVPFVTDEEYQLIEAADLKSLASKYLMAQMQIKGLKARVEEGYSSSYLEKYFQEKVVDLSNFELVQKVVFKYQEFIKLTMFGKDEWSKKMDAIKDKKLPRIEKDLADTQLFMEFLNA